MSQEKAKKYLEELNALEAKAGGSLCNSKSGRNGESKGKSKPKK